MGDNANIPASPKSENGKPISGVPLRIVVAIWVTARFIKRPFLAVDAFLYGAVEEFKSLGRGQREYFDDSAWRITEATEAGLRLSLEEIERVRPALQDSIRNVLIEQWRHSPIQSRGLVERTRLFTLAVMVPAFLALLLAIPVMSRAFSGEPSAIVVSLLLLIGIVLINALFVRMIGRKIVVILGLTVAAFLGLSSSPESPQWARYWLHDIQSLVGELALIFEGATGWNITQSLDWMHVGDATARLAAFTGIVWWGSLAIRFGIWLTTLEQIGYIHRSQGVTSLITHKLALICQYLNAVTNITQPSPVYAVSAIRTELVREAESIARLIEGPLVSIFENWLQGE
ncbi:hypothetical protein ACIBHY_20245 [Nonomuraea sp. NPDC050547]|uniref:hypothetical protein n=1 Tax=Nonomuraea sp. NPDC050547 TaxID=3364368 RepID=UPI0037BB2395